MTRGGSTHKIRLAKNEGKQNRSFKSLKPTERRTQERAGELQWRWRCRWSAGHSKSQRGQKETERQALCVLLMESCLLNPNNQVLCEGAQPDRRNMMLLHGGCGRPKLKLHSRLKNPPTHLFLYLEKYCRVAPRHCSLLATFNRLQGPNQDMAAAIAPWWSTG